MLLLVEETGEASARRTDCLKFDVSLCMQNQKQILIRRRGIGIIFFVGF